MSHASHQEHERARRDQRHADVRDKPEAPSGLQPGSRQKDMAIKGAAPAAPPRHEDEAFGVFDGSSPQSDG
ncbi:hypothetical protein [Herbaspirillum rhizosphaerae]|uniref:hypothetical protein n=1 Tax=Herbaspirillum rhizosphaerae TaxID=346179 RepID=UPI00067B32D1|nr:hypothetical protein [Herbaspirillum rhizosphaerae]